jgi:16S rRNA (cytidine1402-2'-O)-methyltransferase
MADKGHLYVCATPIGNLGDISERLRETLGNVDVLYAEDTRRTAKLLAHLGLSVPMRSLYSGNESARTAELLSHLRSGERVALVSDAGMPSISDPGADAVKLAREEGMAITVIPGPSAVTMAMALSGLAADRFVFEGFLPRKGAERRRRIQLIAREERPVVIFASPHRLVADLEDLKEALGADRAIVVTRELTKMHEEVWSGTLSDAVEQWGNSAVRGEFTLVIAPGVEEAGSLEYAINHARELVDAGDAVSSAAREAAKATGQSRRAIYEALIEGQDRS